jgi:murein DD-endopeptidase MepM/ murein hydrolase activator NlpD
MRRISEQDNQVITAVRLAKVRTKKATDRLAKLEDRQQRVTSRRSLAPQRGRQRQVPPGGRARAEGGRAAQRPRGAARGPGGPGRDGARAVANPGDSEQRLRRPRPPRERAIHLAGQRHLHLPLRDALGPPARRHRHRGAERDGIRAADSGTVQIASWYGGYGNYTCIGHGGGISTCYGHQSSIGVSVGQNVSQGQVIGAVRLAPGIRRARTCTSRSGSTARPWTRWATCDPLPRRPVRRLASRPSPCGPRCP